MKEYPWSAKKFFVSYNVFSMYDGCLSSDIELPTITIDVNSKFGILNTIMQGIKHVSFSAINTRAHCLYVAPIWTKYPLKNRCLHAFDAKQIISQIILKVKCDSNVQNEYNRTNFT